MTRLPYIISPILFILYTEIIFRVLNEVDGVKVGGFNITDLRYADDTALLAENETKLQEIITKVNEEGERMGMKINARKTKTMVISRKNITPKTRITVDGIELEQVNKFIYLGHLITEDGKSDADIKRRIEIAKSTFIKMSKTLTCRKITLNTRKRLMKCYVWSTLLYGAETWSISKAMLHKIRSFEMWCIRKMLKIPWTDRVTNEEAIRRWDSRKELEAVIMKKKTSYCGHILRRTNGLQKILLEGHVEGVRERGRQRLTWLDNIKNWTGYNYQQLTRKAQDREGWKSMIVNRERERERER